MTAVHHIASSLVLLLSSLLPREKGRAAATMLMVLSLAPAASTAETVYAVVLAHPGFVVGSSTLHSGLYRSEDGARTWEHLGPLNLKAYSMDAVDSSNGRIMYIAAGNGVHRSTDYGRSWRITTDWRMTEVLDVKVDQRNPRWVYAATAWGFWRSSDAGETWESPKGILSNHYVYRLTMDRRGMLTAWISSWFDEIPYVTTNNGMSWFADPSDGRDLLPCGNAVAGLQETAEWSGVTSPRLPEMNLYDYACTGGMVYVAGSGGVWASTTLQTDSTSAWSDISAGLPNRIVHAIIPLDDPGALLAGTFGNGLFRRDGIRWTPSGLEGSQIWRLIRKPY